jgi:hypothetical protein
MANFTFVPCGYAVPESGPWNVLEPPCNTTSLLQSAYEPHYQQIITSVPINPYPSIVVSCELKIVGFRKPMSHFAPTVAGCMSHFAHNPSNSHRIGKRFLRIAK